MAATIEGDGQGVIGGHGDLATSFDKLACQLLSLGVVEAFELPR